MRASRSSSSPIVAAVEREDREGEGWAVVGFGGG